MVNEPFRRNEFERQARANLERSRREPSGAEAEWWRLYESATIEGHEREARSCLLQLSLLLSSQLRHREALRAALRANRLAATRESLIHLAQSLVRHGWLRFARQIFRAALRVPDASSHSEERYRFALAALKKLERR